MSWGHHCRVAHDMQRNNYTGPSLYGFHIRNDGGKRWSKPKAYDRGGEASDKWANDVLLVVVKKGKFVLINDTAREHWFSYHRLMDIKYMVIVTYFFRLNLLLPHRLLYPDKQQGIFYTHFPIDKWLPTTTFDGPVMDHWLERKMAQTANASATYSCFMS